MLTSRLPSTRPASPQGTTYAKSEAATFLNCKASMANIGREWQDLQARFAARRGFSPRARPARDATRGVSQRAIGVVSNARAP